MGNGCPAYRRCSAAAALGCLISFVVAIDGAGSSYPFSSSPRAQEDIRSAIDEGDYEEAVRLSEQSIRFAIATYGPDAPETARALNLQVESLLKDGKAAAASTLTLADRAVELTARLRKEIGLEYATSLNNLGLLRAERGEFRAALPLHEQALSIRVGALGPDHPAVADALDGIAAVLIRLDRFAEASDKLLESQRIRARWPDDALRLARTLYLVALLHRQEGDFQKAKTAVDRAWGVQRRISPDHPDTALSVQLQGDLLFFAGDWSGAQELWRNSLQVFEQRLGDDHPLIPRVLRWLASAAKSFGDLAEAERLLDRARAIGREVLASCHPETAALLNDSANLATYGGHFAQAAAQYKEALAIDEGCLGPNHSLTATILHNQGNLAFEMRDLARADALQVRAARAWSIALGPEHAYVARALDARAEVAITRGQYSRARTLYARALAIRERQLGPSHPDTAWTLANLAATPGDANSLPLALARADRATEIYRSGAATDEPDHFARALIISGSIEARRGEQPRALARFAEALQVRERIFGAAHPLTAEARVHLATTEMLMGVNDRAAAGALEAEQVGRDHLRYTVRYLPERQALDYAQRRPKGLDLTLSVIAAGDHNANASVMDNVIKSRGIVLDELAARARYAAAQEADAEALNTAVGNARERFAALMLRSVRGDEAVPRALLDRTRQEKEDAEAALAERSVTARADRAGMQVGFSDVKGTLPPASALVSFVRYERTRFVMAAGKKVPRVSPEYLALVARADHDSVTAIPLGPTSTADALVRQWHDQILHGANSSTDTEAVALYRTIGAALRRRLWDPIAPHLAGVRSAFVVPDGSINLVSFDSLPIGQTQYLVERGPIIHYLSAERDLVTAGDRAASGTGLLAVGGASFNDTSTGPVSQTAKLSVSRSGCNPFQTLRFNPLPGTEREVAEIARVWHTAATDGAGATVLEGRRATERAFKDQAPGRRVLHLATHGFFLGNGCAPAVPATRSVGGLSVGVGSRQPAGILDNPLVLSGLALAGANRRSSDLNQDDGILTAEEVTALDLRGVEWAVLSACDTGLGELKAGEGVLGLRRAFQIAGAHTIIMSLWSVDDQAARAWMVALYEGRFTKRLSTADAVHEATVSTLRTRRAKGQNTHPFYWSGFVAVGDWK
jgi:CHAT domain-containing protein